MSLPSPEPDRPDGWIAVLPEEIPDNVAATLAASAVSLSREMVPRVTGSSARRLAPKWGDRWFGIHDVSGNLVFGQTGTRPRVMRSLAGKTIPMWITDDDGTMTNKVPAHKRGEMTRMTEDGRRQVKIFRKAAPLGSRKTVMRGGMRVSVPRHYPGAPGRVDAKTGRFGGVWWRHPGLPSRQYFTDALAISAEQSNVTLVDIYPVRFGGK